MNIRSPSVGQVSGLPVPGVSDCLSGSSYNANLRLPAGWRPAPRGLLVAFLVLFVALGALAVTPQSPEQAARHWAYQPIRPPTPPATPASATPQNPVDAFLLERLAADGMAFAPAADRRTLLRRVYFDLVGVPPTFEEVEAFRADPSPDPLPAVVDRLLADPRYGERWGRHWLDVARYADTKDLVLLYGKDALRPYAYTYRDYVIRAFNDDLPFTEFVRDQLAADLVEPKVEPWRLAALGFLTLGRLFDNNPHDQIDDQIDTVSRGMLGLTVACARCHDHKYDAISMEDYYGLYGVFASTERPYALPLIEDPNDVRDGPAFERQLARARGDVEGLIDREYERLTRIFRERIGDYLVRAATTKPDLTETTQFALSLTPDDFRPALMVQTRRYLERRLRADDRVFGLWFDLAQVPAGEFGVRAAQVIEKSPRESRNALVQARLAGQVPASLEEVARAYGQLLRDVYLGSLDPMCGEGSLLRSRDERELLEIVTGKESPVAFAWRDTPDHMSRPEKDKFNGLELNLDKVAVRSSNAPPARAMVVADLPRPYESRIFVRGNPSRPGKPAPRGFPGVVHQGRRQEFGAGSGRLELASAITAESNPLTARVFVNRVWMHHFGEPLAASTADFGARSEPPTHPELLDWLAREFMNSGWRLKPLQRLIVLSAAYRQSAVADPGSGGKDPENRLLSHFPRRRLDLEAMRDSLLAESGRLDSVMGGRPVDVAGDALNRRRTVYGLVDRQNLPELFRAFDFAMPDQCAERRPRTSVPQQALFALNSPFVMEQAKALAAISAAAAESPASRVDAMFQRALGRNPTEAEKARALGFIEAAGEGAGIAADQKPGPWEQFAQVLLVSNEAVFVE